MTGALRAADYRGPETDFAYELSEYAEKSVDLLHLDAGGGASPDRPLYPPVLLCDK